MKLKSLLIGLLLLIIGILLAIKYSEHSLPKKIILLTGDSKGAYYSFGLEYKELIAKEGIEVEVRQTKGSLDNIKLLENGDGDIAFIQGGTKEDQDTKLESIASLYREPLWVFYKKDFSLEHLTSLKGKNLSIGPNESGTYKVSQYLLNLNDVTPENSHIFNYNFEQQAKLLKEGQLDAAFFVTGIDAKIIKELLLEKDIALMSFKNHLAYTHNVSFLTKVEIPEGMLDIKENIPNINTVLVAPTAVAVARKGINPRLVEIFLMAAQKIHKKSKLSAEEEFPSPKYLEFPLNSQAESFLRYGPSVLFKYLPFRIAYIIDRFMILIIPLLTVFFPFAKVAPIIYQWNMNKKIYKWYDFLYEVENEFKTETNPQKIDEGLKKLKNLAEDVNKVSVSYVYKKDIYNLKMHISLVSQELASKKNT
jgi:TRAP transporter TAXI family solute receptor